MATDFRDYFNDRISQEIEKNALLGISTKYDQVQAASKEKQASLEDLRKLRLAQEAQAAASWVGQIGLDSQGIPSSLVNVGEAVFEGAKNTGRSIGAAADAFTGNNAGIDSLASGQKAAGEKGPIAKSMLMDEIERRKKADLNPGVISAVQNVSGAMVDNPQGTAEFIAEQLPNSAVALGSGLAGAKAGAMGGAALGSVVPVVGTAAGAAVGGTLGFLGGMFLGNAILETGSKAMEKAQDGGMTDAKRTEAIQEGAIKGGVITAVDAVTLGLGGKAAKTLNKAAIEAGARAEARVLSNAGVDVTSLQAIETALADPILRGSAKAAGRAAAGQTSNIGTKVVTAATGLTMETVGEGTGEYLGELAATGKADVYDAVIEAAAGFTQSAPETAFAMRRARSNDLNAKGITGADLSIPDPVAETRPAPKDRNAIKTAVETGDVSALLDQKSASYSPTDAIAALQGYATRADATPETKQTSLQKATQIVADLEAKKAETQQAYDTVSPEGVAALRTKLDDARANGDDTRAALLETMIADAGADPKAAARLQAQLSKTNQQLMAAKSGLTTLHQELQAKDIDPEVEATKLKDPDPVVSAKAASDIINLSMAIPERLSPSLASEMADDTTNTLTEDQRAYLRKFSAARQAENKLMGMDDVSKEIFLGNADKAMVGIKDYRAGVAAALDAGNRASASKQMAQLSRFVDDHNQKAALAQSALDSGVPSRLVSDGNGGWGLEPGLWSSEAARVENGGLNITMGSQKLVNQLKAEAGALTKAQDELIAAMKISTKEKTNGTQADQAQQTEAQQQKAPSASGARSDVAPATDSAQTDAVTEEATAPAVSSNEAIEVLQDEPVVESGKLTALGDKGPEGGTFQQKRFGDLWKQSLGKKTDGSKRPLVAIKDFINLLSSGTANALDFLKSGTELDDTQKSAVDLFISKSKQWGELIARNLPTLPERSYTEFAYQDPIRYLISTETGKPDLEENVKTAMVAAILAWVNDNATMSALNKDRAINMMLQRSEAEVVSEEASYWFREGTYQHLLVDSLAQKIFDALGLQSIDDVTPMNLNANLRTSLGTHALTLMENLGIIQRVEVPGAVVDFLRSEGREGYTDIKEYLQNAPYQPYHTLFKLTRDKSLQPAGEAKALSDVLIGSKNIISKMVGVESSIVDPSLRPVNTVQEKSDTGMNVPAIEQKTFLHNQGIPWEVNQDQLGVLGLFGEIEALEMAGEETTEDKHIDRVNSIQAKNDGLRREFKNFMDFIGENIVASEEGIAQVMFLVQTMWKQQRSGYESTTVNPQSSKIVRWLISMKDWTSTIKLDDEVQLNYFKLFVADGLGMKIEKGDGTKLIKDLETKLSDGAFAKAVSALQQHLFDKNTEITEAQKNDIKEAVKLGDGNFHSLSALIAWARYKQAEQTNGTEFTTNLMAAVDGVANGTMLNHVMYGAAKDAAALDRVTVRGGFFTLKNKFKQFNLWRGTAGNKDIYEHTAERLFANVTKLMNKDPSTKPLFAAIWRIAGEPITNGTVTSKGRNLIKDALNPLNFGSGISNMQSVMSWSFVESVQKGFEKLAEERDELRQSTINEYVANVNSLLKHGGARGLPMDKSIDTYLNIRFSTEQIKALRDAYKETVGQVAADTVKVDFEQYLKGRDAMTAATNLAFKMYEAVYTARRTELIKELGIPLNKKGEPIHDLTQAQDKALRYSLASIMPVMHTAMSQQNKDLSAGILLADSDVAFDNNPLYTIDVDFANRKGGKSNRQQTKMKGKSRYQSEPGVLAISGGTHSADSAISHLTQLRRSLLNMHDSLGGSISDVAGMVQDFNKNTFNTLLEYSPLSAAQDAMMRVMGGIVAMQAAGTLPANAMSVIKTSVLKGKTSRLDKIFEQIFDASTAADSVKFELLKTMDVVDQYPFQNNGYKVTDKDRGRVIELANKVPVVPSDEMASTLNAFHVLLNDGKPGTTKPVPTLKSVFGEQGTSNVKSDDDLVSFFQANEKASAAEVINQLASSGKLNEVNSKLLKLVSRALKASNPNLTIRYVTPNTDPESVLAMPNQPSRGWYIAKKGGKTEIYVLSPDFKNSGLTSELLLHELVHASIAQIIAKPSKEAAALVAELETLRTKAAEYISDNGLSGFNEAIKDVQEFVAWGMTNKDLQDQVLSKISVPTNAGSNRLVSAMKKFIDTLTALLWKPNDEINNGLSVLVSNVSGLFAETTQIKNTTNTNKANLLNWFGKSVVVDSLGNPQVMYHGTRNSFDTFKSNKRTNGLVFFTDVPQVADSYALDGGGYSTMGAAEDLAYLEVFKNEFPNPTDKDIEEYDADLPYGIKDLASLKAWEQDQIEGANVMPVYLRAENPMGSRENPILWKDAEKLGASGLAKQGYDSVWVTEQGGVAIAVFEGNNQIKSVIGNDGTYSTTSDSILSMASQEEQIDSYNTQDIFMGLDSGAVEPFFQEHLSNLLSGIVQALHGPFGAFASAMRKTEVKNPLAVWLKAIETGRAPFASAIVASGFAGSSQEDFVMQQVELTVKAALERNEATTTFVYKELTKLYDEARAKLKSSDFASQADYDFVFTRTTDNGERSDYLARFAALGLANQKFNKLLKFETAADTSGFGEGKTLFDRMVNVYEKVLAFFSEKMTKAFGGQVADEKLETLVGQLVDIEAKKRHALALKQDGNRYIDPIERGVKRATESLREKATAALNSNIVRDSSSAVVRATGTLARTAVGGYADKYMESLRKVRDAQFKERDGLGAGLLNDLKGPIQAFAALLREVKHRENQRKNLITEHAGMAVNAFKNGASFTKEQTTSITNVFMRTGAHNLLAHFSLAEMDKLLSTPAELTKAIASFEAQLTTRAKSLYVQQANGLGFYKATGSNPLDVLMFNGHAISRLAGTQYTKLVSEQEAKAAEPVITALVSLYALRYTSANEKAMAKEILRAESSRQDGENGVDFLLKVHQKLEKDSLERLFNGNPMLMEHGYTPDIINPHTKVVTANVVDGQRLIAQGYSKGAKVYADPADPSAELRHIYVLRDGGLAPWLSGIFSLTSMKSKGSLVQSGYMDVRNDTGLGNAQLQASITNMKLDNLQSVIDPGRDMSRESRSNLAPVYNDKGEIVNWRYLMQAKTKDDLLERDNRFDQVLGTLAGSIYDKVSSQESNEKAIGALREQYKEDHSYNSDAYVMVGAKSSDPEMRELWQMLPDGTKRSVRKIWGIDGMYVRKDSLDIFFGYRKLSAADFLRKERAALEGVQKIARSVFHLYAKTRGMDDQQADDFAKRMGVALAKGERGWQEIVQVIKDVIVVKNIFTLLGNIYSNDSLLFAKGVDDRWKHQLVAIKGAMAYQEDSRKLMELETKLKLGYTQGKDAQMRDQVVALRDQIDRNPVKKLIDAGLMPTIVEDVAADEDIYSYKTLLQRKTEGITNRVPEGLKTVGRNVFMTRDTKAYQFLYKTTQLSDFTARYALYQHLTTRAENPLTHEDAIQEASDSFVNYDAPMHRTLQYTDDMGFTPFSKYFLRIQRVLMNTLRENPARVLGLLAFSQLVDLGPIVLDSSWIHNFGDNPFRSGALQGFGVIDELPAVAASMALIK